MARKLLIVDDTFIVEGRGLVLTPGIQPQDGEAFSDGDPIQLRSPDGAVTDTIISSLHIPSPNPNHEVWIMLPRQFAEGDVAFGTEVWSLAFAPSPNTE